jgi:hypothetical protein
MARTGFPAGKKKIFSIQSVQTGSGAHSAFYPMGNRGLFPWG